MRIFLIIFLLLFYQAEALAQVTDSTVISDSMNLQAGHKNEGTQILDEILKDNIFLNSGSNPVAIQERPRISKKQNTLFYILAGIFLFFGIIKTVFDKYFSTLFRVFFNSSLRQSQLTDQLMQSTVPALFFNILFVFTAGIYAYFLIQKNILFSNGFNWWLLLGCVAASIIIYGIKFIGIKLLSWVTGYGAEGNIYIFIVFFINKIIGICLLPFIAILAFSDQSLLKISIPVSLVLIIILLLFRFLRSYGLLENKLKVNRFHFMLYIFSFEILPIIIIYKAVGFFILKNG